MPQPRRYASRDRGVLQRKCDLCGRRVGAGRVHGPGCPEVYPDAPPGRYYSPADVAELCGIQRQYMTPILNRWRAGAQRENDPPLLVISDRVCLEHEALVKWLAEHKPKWYRRMEQTAIRSRLCVTCGEKEAHAEGCWRAVPEEKRRKMKGFCGGCGKKMEASYDYGKRTCRTCLTVRAVEKRETLA